jgi:hypothetical protein
VSILKEKIRNISDCEIPELHVEVITGPHRGMHWDFDQGEVSVGRGLSNDIILGDDLNVSRSHLLFAFMDCERLQQRQRELPEALVRILQDREASGAL